MAEQDLNLSDLKCLRFGTYLHGSGISVSKILNDKIILISDQSLCVISIPKIKLDHFHDDQLVTNNHNVLMLSVYAPTS